jgi:pimeloyl-ACP methyl ester carboxylesterase
MEDLTFEKPDTTGIEEQACVDAANRMKRVAVPVSTDIAPSGSVGISYIHWRAQGSTNPLQRKKTPPLILIHGFDSSGLEYRRLGPQLAARGIDTYAVDVLGWGFTQLSEVTSFSAAAKVEALKGVVQTLLGPSTPFVIAGASLGGAAAIELAAELSTISKQNDTPSMCAGLILIDAQGFTDGVGPMASLPKPLAKLGVGVLKSIPLRNAANKMSYFDVDQFATEEAQVIGRLHCLRDGWSDAMVSFMQSGGFSPSAKISKITSPALVLWGRQDGILEGNEFANKVRLDDHEVGVRLKEKAPSDPVACLPHNLTSLHQFLEELPDAQLQWIEKCGHVPHLEKPDVTANAIATFLESISVGASSKTSIRGKESFDGMMEGKSAVPTYFIGSGVVGALILEELIKQFF